MLSNKLGSDVKVYVQMVAKLGPKHGTKQIASDINLEGHVVTVRLKRD